MEEKEPDVPPVTKDALKQAIENTAKLEADDYTADSWEVFQEALNKAKERSWGKEDATQEEVDNAKTTLEEAQNGLKEKPDVPLVTKDALKQAIENTAEIRGG